MSFAKTRNRKDINIDVHCRNMDFGYAWEIVVCVRRNGTQILCTMYTQRATIDCMRRTYVRLESESRMKCAACRLFDYTCYALFEAPEQGTYLCIHIFSFTYFFFALFVLPFVWIKYWCNCVPNFGLPFRLLATATEPKWQQQEDRKIKERHKWRQIIKMYEANASCWCEGRQLVWWVLLCIYTNLSTYFM